MYLKPVEGLTVLDPETGAPLPPEGREIDEKGREPQLLFYWRKRLKERSVVIASPSEEKSVNTSSFEHETRSKKREKGK